MRSPDAEGNGRGGAVRAVEAAATAAVSAPAAATAAVSAPAASRHAPAAMAAEPAVAAPEPVTAPDTPPSVVIPPLVRERRGRGVRGWLGGLPKPLRFGLPLLLALLLGWAWYRAVQPPPAPPPDAPAAVRLVARAQVRPVLQARVGTLTGGTVMRLPVEVGTRVVRDEELARVRAADGSVEVLTAPWSGTITNAPVRLGDTVTLGTTLVHLGDLSRLQVETTDLDEFLIASVAAGQPVRVTVDAIEGVSLRGWVRSLALAPERTTAGDEHYPAIVELDEQPAALRPGMSARVYFNE